MNDLLQWLMLKKIRPQKSANTGTSSTLVREGISFRDKVAAAKDLDVEKDLAAENEVDFDEKEIVISLKGPIPVVDFSDQLEQRPAIGKRL